MQRPTDDVAIRPNAQRVVETAKDSRMVGKPRQRKVKGTSRVRGKAPPMRYIVARTMGAERTYATSRIAQIAIVTVVALMTANQ